MESKQHQMVLVTAERHSLSPFELLPCEMRLAIDVAIAQETSAFSFRPTTLPKDGNS